MTGRRGYWGAVFRRAWRQAVAKAPWSTSLKVVCAVAPAFIGAAATYAAQHKIAVGALSGLGLTAAITLAAVLIEAWWIVPADMHREADAAHQATQRALAGYTDRPKADLPARDAIFYIMTRQWPPASYADGAGVTVEAAGRAIDEIQAKAYGGDIQVWGRTSWANALQAKIEQSFWLHGRIDILTVFSDQDDRAARTNKVAVETPSQYMDVHLCRAQVEREWPA